VFKSDGVNLWANRILWLAAGGLIVLIVMSLVAVAPVKSQNAALTKQLDELQNGAARLLGESKAYVASKSYANAKQSLETLFAKQPSSSEAVEGRKLYAEIESAIGSRDQKWEASVAAVRSAWEKRTAEQLRAEADAARQKVEASMADTLKSQWEQSKDRVRQDWEKGES
jgi:hypothetical protein